MEQFLYFNARIEEENLKPLHLQSQKNLDHWRSALESLMAGAKGKEVNVVTEKLTRELELKEEELRTKDIIIKEQSEQIILLQYANSIESSVACSHVEIFGLSVEKLLYGPEVVFAGINDLPVAWVNDFWNGMRTKEFVADGVKEAPHQQFLEWMIPEILRRLEEKRNTPLKIRFRPLPKLPTTTHKVPDLAIFPTNDRTQSFLSALVLGEVEGPRPSYYAEGMGQAISYSARMLKARVSSKGRDVSVFFCTALEINIMRRRLSTAMNSIPEDKIYHTKVLPLWTIAPRDIDKPTDGFHALVRLLSATPSALDPLLSVPVGPSRLSLELGGVLERCEDTYTVIGRGGFSTVYGATLGKDYVAIKVMSRELVLHEAAVLKAINTAYQDHTDPGRHFIRLHPQHGADPTALIVWPVGIPLLSVVLNNTLANHQLDSKTVMDHIRMAAQALHAMGYVHLDCGRLSNYIITGGFVRMIDFGLSAHQNAQRKGLVGVRNAAATVVCKSEFSLEQWVVVSDLDTESLSYLCYCLNNAGDMPWAQSMKDAKTQKAMDDACAFREQTVREWSNLESNMEKAVAVPTAVADTTAGVDKKKKAKK